MRRLASQLNPVGMAGAIVGNFALASAGFSLLPRVAILIVATALAQLAVVFLEARRLI